MKPLRLVVLAALVALTSLFVAGCFGVGASVSGRVIYDQGAVIAPIKGATIKLDGQTTRTNESGYFSLDNVETGSRTIYYSALGFHDCFANLYVTPTGNSITLRIYPDRCPAEE